MPLPGERAAPTFDPERPRELYRFFDQLELLFTHKNIVSEAVKKKYACRYATYEVERIWVRFKEYGDITASFDDFKTKVLAHYPDAEGDFVYSAKDLDDFVVDQLAKGIKTADELMKFHLHFVTISQWLIDKELMGEIEQRREYIRAFAQPLLTGIKIHLKMSFLKHHPSKPHKIEDVYEAALYTLQDGGFLTQPMIAAIPPQPVPVASSSNMPVKAETFATVMGEFSRTIADALHQNNRPQFTPAIPRQTNCNFCGGDHFIRECKVVDEYITAGKVRRNFEGKVVLSTGAFVPRDIPGTYLSERVNEWHRRNPGQLGIATLIHTISAEHVRAHTQVPVVPAFQLSAADRITALEAELFNLRARKSTFTPVIKTRAQRARELPEASIEEVDDDLDEPAQVPTPAVVVAPPRAPAIVPKPIVITPLPNIEPEHPFRNAKDASYTPPVARNVGGILKVPAKAAPASAPAYKTLPPIHDASIAVDVYKRAMDSQITITQRELLSLSPEVRGQVRESTTTRRIPAAATNATQPSLQVTFDDDIAYDVAPTFALGKTAEKIPPMGSTIVTDPIELYYNSLEPGESPDIDRLTVAKESTAIRSIHALVDTSQKKECTVDPGCQVVAMSEATCHSLALVYDPRIRLNMESANGTFDWSLGLARNVPFLIGTITLYLQVHVIRSPSYEVLLGRPFDVLTESVIRNYTNEDQTITITDPNTEAQCTIPTFARGTNKKQADGQADF
jgi:hypothetical protein